MPNETVRAPKTIAIIASPIMKTTTKNAITAAASAGVDTAASRSPSRSSEASRWFMAGGTTGVLKESPIVHPVRAVVRKPYTPFGRWLRKPYSGGDRRSGMSTLDETDLEILRLLVEDARRPYSEIAEQVDLSGPTVSDRIDRLVDLGAIRGFTVDLDRSTIAEGVEVLLDVELDPGGTASPAGRLAAAESVEHVIATADDRLLAVATVEPTRARELLDGAVGLDAIDSYRLHVVADRRWSPGVGDASLDVDCVECGNPVPEDGVSATVDGTRYHFCCPVCHSRFEERYERLSESA